MASFQCLVEIDIYKYHDCQIDQQDQLCRSAADLPALRAHRNRLQAAAFDLRHDQLLRVVAAALEALPQKPQTPAGLMVRPELLLPYLNPAPEEDDRPPEGIHQTNRAIREGEN